MYDCLNCPGYCCSYPLIALRKKDVERLAKHFDIAFDKAKETFTEQAHGEKYAMRRKEDEHFGKICRFFDTEERRCTIYKARPKVCRTYPNTKRCGYYDFLEAERIAQDDPDYIATTHHA
ncbi:MAG: YkgJ family cysteine cluster protein [Pseudomonadota bacterium]